MTMADRIAVMDHGRLVEVAPPGEIYERPRTRFVAEFVGDINILEGQVAVARMAAGRSRRRARRGPLLGMTRSRLSAEQAVAVAVRPEKMRLSRQKPPPGTPNVLGGRGVGHRLSRRLDRLSRAARRRRDRARHARQRISRRRAADRLGAARPCHLRARCGDRADGIEWCSPLSAARRATPSSRRRPFSGSLVFFLAPFLIVLKISLSDPVTAQPPYTPVFEWAAVSRMARVPALGLDFENFATLVGDDLYLAGGPLLAAHRRVSTAAAALSAIPIAYAMARAPARRAARWSRW